MTATITYVPRPAATPADGLEDALIRLSKGDLWAAPVVWWLSHPSWRDHLEDWDRAVEDACALLRDRDDTEPAGTRTWTEVRDPDYADSQEHAYQRLAAEADQAVKLLRLGPGWWR